jgi:ABC-type bacteriocin/lantibiotic exporter with double-glycine peptidase domain
METKYKYVFHGIPYLKKNWGKLILVFFMSIFTISLSLIPIELLKRLIDIAIPTKDLHMVFMIVGTIFGIYFLYLIVNYLQDITLTKLNLKITRKIQTDFFSGLLWLSPKQRARYKEGQLMERMIEDAGEVVDSTFDLILSPILDLISLLVVLVYMFTISYNLTLMALAFIPIIILMMLPVNKIIRKKYLGVKKKYAEIYNIVQDKLARIPQIIYHKTADQETTNLDRRLKRCYLVEYDYEKFSAKLESVISLVNNIAPYMILIYAAYKIIQGAFQIGTLVAFSMLIPKFFGSIQELVGKEFEFQTLEVTAKRVFELFKK